MERGGEAFEVNAPQAQELQKIPGGIGLINPCIFSRIFQSWARVSLRFPAFFGRAHKSVVSDFSPLNVVRF